jgi:fatty-acyl-CoA synthase
MQLMSTPDIGLANWFLQRALRAPERAALAFDGQTWSYAQVQQQIEQLAGRLHGLGVRRGDRVAFLGLNQPMFLFALFASGRLGAIFVPLNFRLAGPEVAANLDDADFSVLIADAEHRILVDGVRADLPTVRHFLSEDETDGWQPTDDGGSSATDPVHVDPDEVAVIMYTSGTTGRAKGAMLTHGNLWWNNINAMHNFDVLASDVTLAAAPLFHIGGLNVLTLVTLQKGGLVLLHRSFDPAVALTEVQRHRVTTMFGVPTMFQLMAQHPSFANTDLSSLRILICGGAPCPESLLKTWETRGVPIEQGYGLTETAPMVSFLAPEYALSKLGSAGRPPLFTEVRLVNVDGTPVSEPQVKGEIFTRGPNVMRGYWRNPEATAEAIDSDGWFHTGDVGWMDPDGFLTISDRVKDMIISGGENIYPAEVENVIKEYPGIAEVAVIGVPDAKWGETVCAVVTLKAGQHLQLEQLRKFAETRLARYELPRRLEIVPALPRNATGKILKAQLRNQFGRIGNTPPL